MPTFTYTARDTNGNALSGTMSAGSVEEVTHALRREGKYPVSVASAEETAAAAVPAGRRGIKVSRGDVVQLSNQLAIMVETGVTLSEALECIGQQAEKPKVRALLEDVVRTVQSGTDLSTALSRHDRSFPRLYVSLIRASEKSGMMAKLLVRATTYLRDEQDTLRRVKGALVYPGVMLSFAVTTTIFLLAFVLPKFTAIYSQKAAALPLPTKVLMNLSAFLVTHRVALPIAVALAAAGGYAYTRTERGTRIVHWIQLHLPLLGPMFRKLHLARSIRMIGTMAGAGVPLTECVTTAQDLCGNVYFKELWAHVLEQIQVGRQLWEPLSDSPLVPRSITQMVLSGEKSGKLAMVMDQIAMFAEQELKEQIAELTRYIEPLMILLMGALIGGIALALLLPIFTISKVVAN
ncbi:MAG TPA: type II secretion system F family protein [Tepidisphaeraceae bacterium]|nr:type II secretion system F family protein [Tepidisphaeraceae bacterium]